MIQPFKFYLLQGKAKRKTPDPEEAKALLNKAKNRINYVKLKPITKLTADFILEDAYEAAREACQSLMSIKGFKPYSHEAVISFIKQYKQFTQEDIAEFNHFRVLRNNSVYKAVELTKQDAESAINFAGRIIEKIIPYLAIK